MARPRAWFAAGIAIVLMAAGVMAATDPGGAPAADPRVRSLAATGPSITVPETVVGALLASRPDTTQPETPLDLQKVIDTFALQLGVPSPKAPASEIPATLGSKIASVLDAMAACHRVSLALEVDVKDVFSHDDREPRALLDRGTLIQRPPAADQLQQCAQRLSAEVASLTGDLTTGSTFDPLDTSIDAWPILRIEAKNTDTLHVHDYALLIDMGGDDVYTNNAGGNFLDVKRGPAASAALLKEPAMGCGIVAHLVAGECVIGTAVLIDMRGDDTYGVKSAPLEGVDARCTRDKVIQRIVIQGAGFAGVGLLTDVEGRDTYTGRTLSQGAGHVFGIGRLRDEAGNDRYNAMRNSQGFSLVGGIGINHDLGGNDKYDHYMTQPIDPLAAFEAEGSGGVVDDAGRCDNMPRLTLGAGNVGGVGVLVNEGGADHYDSSERAQGRGELGGIGMFTDRLGNDHYKGVPGRGDNMVVDPRADNPARFEDSPT